MGCISSKLLARSVSLHEERKSGLQRKVNGVPMLEDLLISANGNDQYLALVCAANAVVNKLHSRSFSSNQSPKPATQHFETADKWEISAILDQQGGKQIDIDLRKRSKSYHWFPEQVVSQEKSSSFQDEYDLSSKGAVRSRSFHTVEEYDAMLDRIWFSKSHKYQQSGVDLEDDNKNSAIKENSHNSSYGLEKKGEVPFHNTHAVETETETASAAQGGSSIGKGNKRRAVAERLGSLRIASEKECPAIASLREWLPAGGIYSGSYVTPKFGSYSLTTGTNANKSNEGCIFSPELVSAFEQCMKNLEAEEENILKQIIQNLEEANGGDMQSQEATPPCIHSQTIHDG